jgi:hypothetical protein
MYERLIYPTKVEMEGTREILRHTFPLVKLWDVADPTDPFITDMELSLDEPCFFRWAIQPIRGAGHPIIFYCLNLSIHLLAPPPWMAAVLREIRYSQPPLLSDNNEIR